MKIALRGVYGALRPILGGILTPYWSLMGVWWGLVELKTRAHRGRDVPNVEFAAHAAPVHVEQVRFRGSGLALGRVREEKEIRARIFEREVAAMLPAALIAAVAVRQVAHVVLSSHTGAFSFRWGFRTKRRKRRAVLLCSTALLQVRGRECCPSSRLFFRCGIALARACAHGFP